MLSGVRLSRHYMTGMRARDWGRIVFVSSESAVQIPVEMIHYGMTKTAQLAVARGLAETLVGHGRDGEHGAAGPDGVGGRGRRSCSSWRMQKGIDFAAMEKEFFRPRVRRRC